MTDCRRLCGIGRIEQPDALDRVLQVAGDDVRLDDGEQVGLVDLEDAVQPLEAEHDAAVHGHGAAGIAGAATARHERRARLVAQRAIAAISCGVRGQDDDVRRVPALEGIGP